MKARFAAAMVALSLAVPTAGLAAENPWTAIKKLFHEPVSEFKQQLEQFRPPLKATTKAKAPAKAVRTSEPTETANSDPAPATIPTPVAKPVATKVPDSAPATAAVSRSARALPVKSENDDGVVGQSTAENPVQPTVPIPRPRPDVAIAFASVGSSPAKGKSAEAIGALGAPLGSLRVPPPVARSTCGASLARLGVEALAIAPISEGVCGVQEPVAVAALGGGVTDLTTKAIIACNLAETFANWLGDEVQPAARNILGGEVVGLRVAASYTCRSRNNVAGAKLSEHGRGNAIDISAFNVEGRGWIEVGSGRDRDEVRFLKTIRTAACGPFKTVLGPGSDAYHGDHFHLDLAERTKRGKSRGLYCK